MRCVERIDCHGFLDKVKFVAANDVGFRACALVSCGPKVFAILFDFIKELVGPEVFQFNLDVLGEFIQIVHLALHLDCGDGGFRAVDDQVDGDLEERTNKGETFFRGPTFFAVFV
jgi:hypothetical protein